MHVIVDLIGWLPHNRQRIFAHRPAPRAVLMVRTPAASAPGVGSPRQHRQRGRAHPSRIGAGTGLTPPTSSAPGRAGAEPKHSKRRGVLKARRNPWAGVGAAAGVCGHVGRGLLRRLPHRRRRRAAGVRPGSPLPHLRRDWARPFHICVETGLTCTSRICTGTGLTPAHICAATRRRRHRCVAGVRLQHGP